jgi:serine/threonine protein phosphatase 1
MSAARTYVIGDIHGCLDEVDRLLDEIAPESRDTVCFLGDYIDRGPSSKAVIERMLRLESEGPRCTFLKGNHEDMFLDYLGLGGHYGDVFLQNGGGPTLASYGFLGLSAEAIAERLPADHKRFLLGLQSTVRFGRFLCVHAGLRPERGIEEQSEEDLFWIRKEFTSVDHLFPYTVIFGHTPQQDVMLQLPFKIGLDTGLVYGNRLSCLELVEKDLWQVERHGDRVLRRSLAAEFGGTAAWID